MRKAIVVIGIVMMAEGARAERYVSLGVGAEAGISGSLGDHFSVDNASSVRVGLGARWSQFALETSLTAGELSGTTAVAGLFDYNTLAAAVDLKFFIPIAGALEGAIHGGIHKQWLLDHEATDVDYSGVGYQVGAGLQYGFNLAFLARSAVWLDFTRSHSDLTDPQRMDLDGSVDHVTLGLSVGF